MRSPYLSAIPTAIILLLPACSAEKSMVATPNSARQTITDAPPYVCKLVPEQAFRAITGTVGPISGETVGSEASGECRTPDPMRPPLQVNWLRAEGKTGQEHIDYVMDGRLSIYTRHNGVTIPADLGNGMVAYLTSGLLAQQPYRISAKFRCGGKDRMLDIYLAKVAKGRDAIQDLIVLMRIAQSRYGELYDCTPQGTQGTQGAQSHSPQATATATQQLTGKPG
ncbi:hypothetical protein [Nonomuraea ceibae]|uniref:hypothetical protein n=1 Tax=Nonomuraea ceibae TaxID=1935170 RepID=UPI001C5CD97E|nr:hypothetical protein [Nonomuraea ceibae]